MDPLTFLNQCGVPAGITITSPFLSSWISGFWMSLSDYLQRVVGPAHMSIYRGATDPERRTSVHNVKDIGFFYMDLLYMPS